METVRIIHKGFAVIASLGFFIAGVAAWSKGYNGLSVFSITLIAVSLMIYPVYCLLLNTLFYVPLSKHKEWVVANGIFSTTPVETKYARTAPWISFGKSASIADELIKLNNLKDANLITLDEFNALRSKLLS
jgi:TM2 domain-containing membrane protein YozV